MSQYLQNRISYYEAGHDQVRIDSIMTAGLGLADRIFAIIKRESAKPENLVYTQQMVPAANLMFDLASSREIYRLAKVPVSVIQLLVFLSMVVSFINGVNQDKGRPNWIAAAGYTLLITFSFILILDMVDNRSGRINLDTEQKTLKALTSQLN
jgi:predicted benzoate:H+ symporter BenE